MILFITKTKAKHNLKILKKCSKAILDLVLSVFQVLSQVLSQVLIGIRYLLRFRHLYPKIDHFGLTMYFCLNIIRLYKYHMS